MLVILTPVSGGSLLARRFSLLKGETSNLRLHDRESHSPEGPTARALRRERAYSSHILHLRQYECYCSSVKFILNGIKTHVPRSLRGARMGVGRMRCVRTPHTQIWRPVCHSTPGLLYVLLCSIVLDQLYSDNKTSSAALALYFSLSPAKYFANPLISS